MSAKHVVVNSEVAYAYKGDGDIWEFTYNAADGGDDYLVIGTDTDAVSLANHLGKEAAGRWEDFLNRPASDTPDTPKPKAKK